MKLKDSNKLSLISGEGIYIKGLEVSGVKERTGENKNSTISIQSQTLNISGLKAIDIQCYNLIEQPWKKDTEKIKEVRISNYHGGPGVSHNHFNFYNLASKSVIEIKDSKIKLSETSNILRLDNLSRSKDVKVIFKNVDWEYDNPKAENMDYLAAILLQPGDKTMYGQDIFNGWTFVFDGCSYGGQRLTKRDGLEIWSGSREDALIYGWEGKLTKYNVNVLIK